MELQRYITLVIRRPEGHLIRATMLDSEPPHTIKVDDKLFVCGKCGIKLDGGRPWTISLDLKTAG